MVIKNNTNPCKVGLDIDGVLADFWNHFLNVCQIKDRSPASEWKDKRIDARFHEIAQDESFWLSMPVLIEPRELQFTPVLYVTARPISNEISREWLRMNGFPEAPVLTAYNKAPVIGNSVDYFIDDAPHNYLEIKNFGKTRCLLLNKSYNQCVNAGEDRIQHINEVTQIDESCHQL